MGSNRIEPSDPHIANDTLTQNNDTKKQQNQQEETKYPHRLRFP